MKTKLATGCFLLILSSALCVQAQSTTGGRSGGSTASTGTGYLTEGKRPAETSASSMTIADEGASRDYMYVPPAKSPNRAASPDGSGRVNTPRQPKTNSDAKKPSKLSKTHSR